MELCAKSIKETEANPNLFEFIRSSLLRLDKVELSELSLFHIRFLLGLTKHLGFSIHDNWDENNGYLSLRDGYFTNRDQGPQYSLDNECSRIMHLLIQKEIDRVPKVTRDKILDGLILYYRYHVDDFNVIKSLEVLRSIFSA